MAVAVVPAVVALTSCSPAPRSTAAPPPASAPAEPTPSPPVEASAGSKTIQIDQLGPVSPEQRQQYTGSRACLECHPKYAEQLDSHHAHTLARMDTAAHAALFRRKEELVDPTYGVTYRPKLIDGKPHLEVASKYRAFHATPEYVFGSGNRTFVYVGRPEGKLTELRLSYYRQADRWYWTATQEIGSKVVGPLGRARDREDFERCFTCHATALVKDGDLKLDQSLLGVTCETCHGPGRPHVQAVRRGEPDLRMARLSAARAQVSAELCGQCHRGPATGDPEEPMLKRALPRLQGLALAQSKCFTASKGRLTCVTCHDPHRNASRITMAEYNGQCKSCHTPSEPSEVPCPVQPRGNCVPCHMPSQAVTIPTNPTFRNHWIKAWKQSNGGGTPGTGAAPAFPDGSDHSH